MTRESARVWQSLGFRLRVFWILETGRLRHRRNVSGNFADVGSGMAPSLTVATVEVDSLTRPVVKVPLRRWSKGTATNDQRATLEGKRVTLLASVVSRTRSGIDPPRSVSHVSHTALVGYN